MKLDTIHAFSTLAQARRGELGLSQADAAAKAGVSRKWLSNFESGKPTVELGKVLALLEALAVVLDARALATRHPDGHTNDDDIDLDSFLADYHSDR